MAGCRGCSTAATSTRCSTARPPEDEPRLAAPQRRRGARGALRLGAAGQRAVRARRRIARPRAGGGHGVGQGREGAPRAGVGTGGGRAAGVAARAPRRGAGRRRPSRGPRCSATSGAPPHATRRAPHPRSALAVARRTRTPCATASPPTCSTGARTSGRCRSCSATPTWPRRSATPTSAGSGCGRPTPTPTREHEHRRCRPVPRDAMGSLAQAAQRVGPRPPDRVVRPAGQVHRRAARCRVAVDRRPGRPRQLGRARPDRRHRALRPRPGA